MAARTESPTYGRNRAASTRSLFKRRNEDNLGSMATSHKRLCEPVPHLRIAFYHSNRAHS